MNRVFLAYANAKSLTPKPGESNFLHHLEDEYHQVSSILTKLDDANIIKVKSVPFVTKIDHFTRHLEADYLKDLIVFGFSGHAGPEGANYENKQIRWDGLSRLLTLSNCPDLKFVFLNACHTQYALPHFEDLEIPIIITTDSSVPDESAKKFATVFFQNLASKQTIYNSYEKALDFIKISTKIEGITARNYRDANFVNQGKIISSWLFNFREERFKDWTLEMGKEEPKEINLFNTSYLISELVELQSIFQSGYASPYNCDHLINTLQTIKQSIQDSSIPSVFQYAALEAIETILGHTEELHTIVLRQQSEQNNLIVENIITNLSELIDYLNKT